MVGNKVVGICLKKLMVKNSFIEKTYVVGTHLYCLIEAFPMCTFNISCHANINNLQ